MSGHHQVQWLCEALLVSRSGYFDWLWRQRLWARHRSKYRVATTESRHAEPIAPDRLLEIKPSAPNQVWITDATCVLSGEAWLCVISLLDVFTRRVVGRARISSLDAAAAVHSLAIAIAQRRPAPGLIVHWSRQPVCQRRLSPSPRNP